MFPKRMAYNSQVTTVERPMWPGGITVGFLVEAASEQASEAPRAR